MTNNPSPDHPNLADGMRERIEVALRNRQGAGNLIGGKFIADPPVTILADDARAILCQLHTIKWLADALEPFATIADQYADEVDGYVPAETDQGALVLMALTVGDFRRAAEALRLSLEGK